MSDLAARIKDLTERIDGIKAERAAEAEMYDDAAARRGNIFFDASARRDERQGQLERELAELQSQGQLERELAELQGQASPAAGTSQVPASAETSLDYPEISVPDASAGGAPLPLGVADFPLLPTAPPLELWSSKFDQVVRDKAKGDLTIDDVANFDTPISGPGASERPRTQERPGTGVKDPVPETRSPVLVIAAAGLVAAVLAIGVWQAVAGSPQTASVATTAPVPTTTSRPATTAAPVAAAPTATAVTIRVTGQPAVYSGACNGYSVTFAWIIEGTQSGNFMMRTGKGDAYGPESGPFTLSGSNRNFSWDPASGRLMILGATDSGASPGFRSQITKVNGRAVEGDATSIAAPGYCS